MSKNWNTPRLQIQKKTLISFALYQLTRDFSANAKPLSTPQRVTHCEWIKQVFEASFTADMHPRLRVTRTTNMSWGGHLQEAASTGHSFSTSLPGIPWLIAWTGCFSCGCQTWIQSPAWSPTLAGILCSHCCCDPTLPGNNKQVALVKGNCVPHTPKPLTRWNRRAPAPRPLVPAPTKPCPPTWLRGFLWVHVLFTHCKGMILWEALMKIRFGPRALVHAWGKKYLPSLSSWGLIMHIHQCHILYSCWRVFGQSQ